ncbi:MAG: hypothetical protein KDM64_10970 [Verrucomicrobiae bacterium]|nr:hypothetical protein [Verrucomicrobiae bacterium]
MKSLPNLFPFAALLTAAAILANTASAEEAKPAAPQKPSADHTVIVPYDASLTAAEQTPAQYYLDYPAFERLWRAAKDYRLSQSEGDGSNIEGDKDFILTNALYRVTAAEDRLVIEGQLGLLTRGKAWQKVPLPFGGVNLSKITLDDSPASYQDGAVLIEAPGRHSISVTYEVALPSENAPATWQVPTASATLLAITLDSDLAEPVINGGLPLAKSGMGGPAITYTAALGQAGQIEFRRRPGFRHFRLHLRLVVPPQGSHFGWEGILRHRDEPAQPN